MRACITSPFLLAIANHAKSYTARNSCSGNGMHWHCKETYLGRFCNSSMLPIVNLKQKSYHNNTGNTSPRQILICHQMPGGTPLLLVSEQKWGFRKWFSTDYIVPTNYYFGHSCLHMKILYGGTLCFESTLSYFHKIWQHWQMLLLMAIYLSLCLQCYLNSWGPFSISLPPLKGSWRGQTTNLILWIEGSAWLVTKNWSLNVHYNLKFQFESTVSKLLPPKIILA